MPDFTLQYVYQLSDFDTSGTNDPVPNEGGAQAAGSPPFQLQLDPGASPLQVGVTDVDDQFDEINNAGQVLTSDITIDGTLYPAGTSILVNYVITTDSGFSGYSITIGATNSGNNATTAFITNEPMVPGQVYNFTSEGNIGGGSIPYAQLACFADGTEILTVSGPVAVDDLRPGHLIVTTAGAIKPLHLVMQRHLTRAEIALNPNLRPIRIEKGALGCGLPKRDLRVSPQHRMLIRSDIAERMFDAKTVLIAAKKLLGLPGITVDATDGGVTYFHLVLDQHEVVFAEGAPTESFYFGDAALGGLQDDARQELYSLFPELARPDARPPSAHFIPTSKQQKKWAERHRKNNKAIAVP